MLVHVCGNGHSEFTGMKLSIHLTFVIARNCAYTMNVRELTFSNGTHHIFMLMLNWKHPVCDKITSFDICFAKLQSVLKKIAPTKLDIFLPQTDIIYK